MKYRCGRTICVAIYGSSAPTPKGEGVPTTLGKGGGQCLPTCNSLSTAVGGACLA